MRIESSKPMKNGGWWHWNNDRYPKSVQHFIAKEKNINWDFDTMLARWSKQSDSHVKRLAIELGVSDRALGDLGTGYSEYYKAYAFPMHSPDKKIIGIRLRNNEKKWAVKGSKSGLFIAWAATLHLPVETVMICEGPTDTAAALTLGFFAIGRPACLGCEEMIADVLKKIHAKDVIICYDNDDPGIRGADKLVEHLKCHVTRIVPPAKDLRDYVAAGGTRELLLSMIRNTVRT